MRRWASRKRLMRRKFASFKANHKFSFKGWGLKTIDYFILKKFLGTYFFATLLILAIISMFDITEKLDAFLTAPLKETLFDYFCHFSPILQTNCRHYSPLLP